MLRKDTWLSGYFPKGAYRYDVPEREEEVIFPTSGFIYSKVSADNQCSINHLIKERFSLQEVLLQFEQKTKLTILPKNDVEIAFATKEDKSAIRQIAKNAFQSSRFFTDQNIPTEIAQDVKADWACNFFKGLRGDGMIVAKLEQQIVGFLLLTNKTVIDLIAVSDKFQNKGIARSMIHFANEKRGLLSAGTQLINKSSIALYQRAGFQLVNASFVFHRHII